MALADIVVGSTRKSLDVTIVDSDGAPVNITGATSAPKLQGKSSEISTTIDATGTIVDAANGKVRFSSMGTLITHANLASGGVTAATFKLRVKWYDAAGLFDYGEEFSLRWVDNPLGA